MSDIDDDEFVWVRTHPSSSGRSYVVTVEYSKDVAVTIKPSEGEMYAGYVLASAMRAAHDAAVFAQLTTRGLSSDLAAQTILSLRADRPDLVRVARVPVELVPGVNDAGDPFLVLVLAGEEVAQWTVEDARSHAHGVLEAVSAADLDAAYYRHLIGVVGVEEPTARAVVGDLLGRVSGS